LIIALFWAIWGIEVEPKKILSALIVGLILTTMSLYLPNTFRAIEKIAYNQQDGVDSKIV
jgi:hypothetical protein